MTFINVLNINRVKAFITISHSDLHKCRKFFTGLPCHKEYQTPFFLIKQKSEGEVLDAFSSQTVTKLPLNIEITMDQELSQKIWTQ